MREFSLFSHDLGAGAGATYDFTSLALREFDIMYHGAGRDMSQQKAIPHFNFRILLIG